MNEPISTDIDDVDFEKLIQDLKTADCNELIKSAKIMISDTSDVVLRSIVFGIVNTCIIKSTDCIDIEKLIAVIDEIDPLVIKNLIFKITGALGG